MLRILVVEDEPALRADLVDYLTMKGFMVEGTDTAAGLLDRMKRADPPTIIILDIGLPDGNGFDLARIIRQDHACGLIMLTSASEVEDRVRGYQSGADIYLVKHTSLREIEAAVGSLHRRVSEETRDIQETVAPRWVLDKRNWMLIGPNQREALLTATELSFLSQLMQKNGETCSREELVAGLERQSGSLDNRHLDTIVSRLRRKILTELGVESPIKVVYGVGYAFTDTFQIA